MNKRQIALLGSTGSIGTQALDVVRDNADRFEVYALVARQNVDLLAQQAREFRPEVVVIADEQYYAPLKEALADLPMKVWAGTDAIADVVQMAPVDVVLTAMVGYAGLRPTLAALEAGKAVALANKETLVVAGELVTATARRTGAPILPVDSEHSAIFQCLVGQDASAVEKVILTASGGPFRTTPREALADVTPAEALRHPNWSMGAKVTIDSASMMNKGFEMIEARWLFGLPPDRIEVVVHPQSIVHSMVQFADGAVMAQLGTPDMHLPIAYALAYPRRLRSAAPRPDFAQLSTLTFEAPDRERFRNLDYAYEAARRGGNMPCILNAADEVAVAAFLSGKIGFLAMSDLIAETMARTTFIATPTYDDYVQTDAEARRIATEITGSQK
jgi:1-deoxy-D-xylulose 5-phosphate reductoisomerase